MIDRPLNVHPDIWNHRRTTIQNESNEENKQFQLDQFTKLCNSIDMIVQGLYNFKKNYQNINFQQYSDNEKNIMGQVNSIIDSALIPYTIDVVKQLNKLSQDKITNENK